MADLFENRLKGSLQRLAGAAQDKVDVTPERSFLGFDAYKKAIDCLGPHDVAMLTSFAYVRPLQLEYAVKKGVNAFLEKSFAPDAPNLRRLIAAWQRLAKEPDLCRDLDICAFLDRAETETKAAVGEVP